MDSVYLHGSEDVSRAASQMASAASSMQSAASSIASSLEQNQRFLDDWLQRLEAVLEQQVGKP